MSKPLIHARASARKFGGDESDYISIHEKMDSTKIAYAEVSHRVIFHSAFGIYLIEDIFGKEIINSEGGLVSVRDIAEQHVLEDLGCIPSLGDWLSEIKIKPWMAGHLNARMTDGHPVN